jgi:hypothetical protein
MAGRISVPSLGAGAIVGYSAGRLVEKGAADRL